MKPGFVRIKYILKKIYLKLNDLRSLEPAFNFTLITYNFKYTCTNFFQLPFELFTIESKVT